MTDMERAVGIDADELQVDPGLRPRGTRPMSSP